MCENQKRKINKKSLKKVLTLLGQRGIIYKSTRYGNKTKAKVARQNDGFSKEKSFRFEEHEESERNNTLVY